MAKILKFVSFQQLLKHILKAFSSLGGDKSDICGLGHSGSQPFNYSSAAVHPQQVWVEWQPVAVLPVVYPLLSLDDITGGSKLCPQMIP